MSRGLYSSSFETVGDSKDPDVIYYNASIVNNTTDDVNQTGTAYSDPPVRFNETRDTAIVKDASKYQFSIVRFVVNGANKDLPLFIPQIQSSTGQTDVNLTVYGLGLTWNGEANVGSGTVVGLTSGIQYVEYIPETQNPLLAPIPRTTASASYVGDWSSGTAYRADDIVSWPPGAQTYYVALQANSGLIQPPSSPLWSLTSPSQGQSQDLTSRYYWVYSYEHWVDLVNQTLERANNTLFLAYQAAGGNVLPDYNSWLGANPTPILSYNRTSQLFTIATPKSYLPVNVQVTSPSSSSQPELSLYFNSNMEGLFTGFDNTYWNYRATTSYNNSTPNQPYVWFYPPTAPTPLPTGFANQLVVKVEGLVSNIVLNSTLHPIWPQGSPNLNYNGYWINTTQDYPSTSTLWSPIESIVFTSVLLPIQNEQTAPPNALGTGNNSFSASTSQSAFAPIITDVALDLGADGGYAYRNMIYYAPTAEYRMADFQNSKTDIRNIDVSVYWRNRLDNQLYPLTMFNLSSVSIKLMFRKKSVLAKSERGGTSAY